MPSIRRMQKARSARGALLLALTVSIPAVIFAQGGASTAPAKNPLDPVTRGVEAWKAGGFQAGARAWTAGGPMYTGQREANLVKQLQDISKYYGKAVDVRVLAQREAGQVNRILYVVVNLERGPMFARFVNTLRQGSWLVSDLRVSSAPEEVIPDWVFERGN